ncbi:MAG: DUF2892 domain-containing protein [Myxococcales bacterium]|nr:DUF2892 domain-containing protein [Myxococcales bacterium]MDD9969475.1 DUF2892 domain-containing protein [Myxococcales bacterium]
MIYRKNLPLVEQALRVGGGLSITAYAALSTSGVPQMLLLGTGIMAAATGLFGYCPACALVGRRWRE